MSAVKSEHIFGFQACGLCPYQTKSKTALHQHVKHVHITSPFRPLFDCGGPPEPYSCDNCKFDADSALDFNRHVAPGAPWGAAERLSCERCHFATYSKLVLAKHVYDRCAGDEGAQVKVEDEAGERHSDYLKCHRFLRGIPFKHDNLRFLKCEHCSYEIRMKGNLRKHMTSMHSIPQRVRWFECEQCLFNVKQIFALRKHLMSVHFKDVQGFLNE